MGKSPTLALRVTRNIVGLRHELALGQQDSSKVLDTDALAIGSWHCTSTAKSDLSGKPRQFGTENMCDAVRTTAPLGRLRITDPARVVTGTLLMAAAERN